MLTNAFETFIPETVYTEALQDVADILGIDPTAVVSDKYAPELVRLAQNGSEDAKMILYKNSLRSIAFVFFKNFLGPNKRVWRNRIHNGDDQLFAVEAYQRLDDALRSFDVDKYASTTINFLGKWHYWYRQYLTSLAIKLNKEIADQGFTGVRGTDSVKTQSMPTGEQGEERYSVSLSSPSTATAAIDTEDALTAYRKSLSRSSRASDQQLNRVLQLRLDGYDYDDIADQLGVSRARVYSLLRDLKQSMTDFGVFENVRIAANNVLRESYQNIPDWKPFTDVTINEALRFRVRKISGHITHHVSPCYIIVETNLPGRRSTYTMYLRLPVEKSAMNPKREYMNSVDLLVTNHRAPQVTSFSMAKSLLKDHWNSGGRIKGGIDPSSPQHWIQSLTR